MLRKNFLIYKILSLFSAFSLLLCLVGCNSDKVSNENNYYSFTDALGRTVNIKEKPQRVAALTGSFADIWLLAGGKICATAEDAFEDFGISSEGVISLGGAHSPSLELLISSDADFVLASASSASNVKMQTAIENAGIIVAYFDVDCFEEYLYMLNVCTDITGEKELYNTNGLALKDKIDNIKNEYKNTDIPKNEKTVLMLRVSSSSVKAKGSEGTVLGEMLGDMGCINIADNDKSLLEKLSIESILEKNPYHIFIVLMGDDTEKAIENAKKLLKENKGYENLDAVKNGRVHLMDKKLFNLKPNGKWDKSYEILKEELMEK